MPLVSAAAGIPFKRVWSNAYTFRDPAAGKIGPIALQMHNAGLFDEFKDVTIEVNPKEDGLITAR